MYTGTVTPFASMRPRHECRGRGVVEDLHQSILRRFNEAPARMPGKRVRAALRRGKHVPASMRPRHECRGRVEARANPISGLTRFNEAPARMPGKRPDSESNE